MIQSVTVTSNAMIVKLHCFVCVSHGRKSFGLCHFDWFVRIFCGKSSCLPSKATPRNKYCACEGGFFLEFFAIDFYGSCSEPFRNRFELTSCLASEQRRNNRICPENKHERTTFTHPPTCDCLHGAWKMKLLLREAQNHITVTATSYRSHWKVPIHFRLARFLSMFFVPSFFFFFRFMSMQRA